MNKYWKEIQQALMTGVSYMLPFVTGGGILIALGFTFGGIHVGDNEGTFAYEIFMWGQAAMGLMLPALAGYISYSYADRPGIAPGFVAGVIANNQGSGFLGAMIGGILAGYLVQALKKIKLPMQIRSLITTIIVPLIGTFIIGFIMSYIIGVPVTWLNESLTNYLNNMTGSSLIVLGLIQGAMLAFDMGGPLNKAAYAFALAASASNNWGPMAANFIASMSPPLGIAFAMLINKKKFTNQDLDGLGGLFVGGLAMITEFAIPYAVKEPFRVIPALMAGSSVGAILSHLAGLTLQAPHGGLLVLFLANRPLVFIGILLIASLVTAFALLALKRNPEIEENIDIS